MKFKLELKNGKFDFDKALKNLGGNHQVLTEAIQRFAKLLAPPLREELLSQYNAYCQTGTDAEFSFGP